MVGSRWLAGRPLSRYRRTNGFGSAYTRPELEAAVAQAQDDIVTELCRVLELCVEKDWLRPGIDLASTVAWHLSVLIGRVYIEHGQANVDPAEWDGLTLEAVERAFFG